MKIEEPGWVWNSRGVVELVVKFVMGREELIGGGGGGGVVVPSAVEIDELGV